MRSRPRVSESRVIHIPGLKRNGRAETGDRFGIKIVVAIAVIIVVASACGRQSLSL